jgi:hypothetical protein
MPAINMTKTSPYVHDDLFNENSNSYQTSDKSRFRSDFTNKSKKMNEIIAISSVFNVSWTLLAVLIGVKILLQFLLLY